MLVAVAVANKGKLSSIAAIISLITISVSIFAGERINFISRAFGGMLAGLSWKPKLIPYCILICIEIAAVFSVFLFNDTLAHRFGKEFVSQLPIHSESAYMRVWKGGIIAFQDSPIIGIGPDVYRKSCHSLTEGIDNIDCHTHPHNFYIQLAGETGIFGLVAGSLMISSIIVTCFSYRRIDKTTFLRLLLMVPLAVFFP